MAQTTRLASFGPVVVVAEHPATYFVIRTYVYYKTLVSIKQKTKKHSSMAQTTRLASFGPVFVVAEHPATYFVIRTYVYYKTLVSIKENTHLWPKRRQTRRLSPFSSLLNILPFSWSSRRVSDHPTSSPIPLLLPSHERLCRCCRRWWFDVW